MERVWETCKFSITRCVYRERKRDGRNPSFSIEGKRVGVGQNIGNFHWSLKRCLDRVGDLRIVSNS